MQARFPSLFPNTFDNSTYWVGGLNQISPNFRHNFNIVDYAH